MASKALVFEIIGIDHASKAFDKVRKSTGKAEGGLNKLKVGGALAFAALGIGVAELAKKSIDKFEEAGKAAIGLQRILGGTAEDASRLAFAGEETGVSVDKLKVGFGILSKHLTANDKAWKGLGVSTKDAHGKTKPFSELLPQISDVFAKMPAGPEKTAMAMKLFGKSGKDLLPFLNRGKDGLGKLNEESDKLGHTLSGPQLDAIKKNIKAHREFKAAVSGVMIQIGAALYPALTKILPKVAEFASTVAQKAIPVIKRFAEWFSGKLIPALTVAYNRIMPGVKKAFEDVTKSLGNGKGGWKSVGDAVLKFIDIAGQVIAVVLPVMIKLWGEMILQYKLAATVVGAFAGVAKTVFRTVANVFLTMAGIIINGAASAFGWIPGIGPKLKTAAKKFNEFAASVRRSLNDIPSHKEITIIARANLDFVQTGNTNKRKARAMGGPVRAGESYIVGERRAELFVPDSNGRIVPKVPTSSGGGGGNQYITVNLTAPGDDLSQARRLVALLQKLQQSSGKPLQIRTA